MLFTFKNVQISAINVLNPHILLLLLMYLLFYYKETTYTFKFDAVEKALLRIFRLPSILFPLPAFLSGEKNRKLSSLWFLLCREVYQPRSGFLGSLKK